MFLATSYEWFELRDTSCFRYELQATRYEIFLITQKGGVINGKQMWWRHQEKRFRHEEEVTCTNSLIKA